MWDMVDKVLKTPIGACKMTGKYEVAGDSRNTLTTYGDSTLRIGPPGPQKVSDPRHYCENFKIVGRSSSYAHSKALDRTNKFLISKKLSFQHFWKYSRKNSTMLRLFAFPVFF